MFFTTLKSDSVKGPQIHSLTCSQCSERRFHLYGTVKYLALELFNLPMFVIKRQYKLQCDCGHCQQHVGQSQQLNALKRDLIPWSYFAIKHLGLLLFVVLASLMWNEYSGQVKAQAALVANPQVNDFYLIDYHRYNPDSHPRSRYTVLKAVAVDEQSLTLQVGNIFKSRRGSMHDHIKSDRAMLDNFFSSQTIHLTLQQLADMVDSQVIYGVERPQSQTIDGWVVVPREQPETFVYEPNAHNQLGISLYRGENGYYRDYKAAFEAFTLAAQANHGAGQNNLAEMYRDGKGTTVDGQKALYWFKQAALQGHQQAYQSYQQLCAQTIDCGE